MSIKIFIFLFSIFYFLFTIKPVYGAEFSVGIYPPLLKIRIDPPATINAPIVVQNLSQDSVTLDIFIKPLEEEKILENEAIFKNIQVVEGEDASFKNLQALILGPQQKKDLFVRINIDENERPKDYYFYIQFVSKEDKTQKDTSYSQILGGVSLSVLASVGKEEYKATLEDFFTPKFVDKSSVPFVVRIKNEGEHFITTKGVITIKNLLNRTVSQIELPDINVLRDSTRSIETSWNRSFILGLYTAQLDLSVLEDGHVFSKTLSFFALPIKSVVAAVILILISIFIFKRVNKKAQK